MSPRKKEPLGVATLADIGRLILHSHDLDETLRNVADLVARRAGTDVCSIYLLAEDGASIKDITHDRAFAGADVSTVNVFCTIETRDHQHVRHVHRLLRQNGIRFRLTPR